jgi:hypothetical protein
MTQPTDYVPSEEFGPFNPSAFPNLGLKLDVEFGNISTSVGEINDNLALIQRDDGELANESVGPDQLQNSVYAGINTPAAWVTATDYSVRDSVTIIVTGSSGYTKWYKCVESHTSGVFADDLAAGYWVLVLQADPGPTGPAGAGTAGSNTPVAVTQSAGVVGVSTAFSREDHVHPLTPTGVEFLLQLIGKRTSSSNTDPLVAATRTRVTAAVTKALPTFAANEWLIVERDTTAGTVTIGRNSQTIDGVSADFTMDVNKDVILFYCDSAGVVVTRFLGVVPT